jgi:endonuclease/exonuclease/phosphatase family metal-dependent hydrolase
MSGQFLIWSIRLALVFWTLLVWDVPMSSATESIRVMSFNIWIGGESGGQPLEQTVQVIKAAGADVVGLQESHGEERDGKSRDAAQAIAMQLGWNYFNQGDGDCGIISRYKIVDHTQNKRGAAIELPSGQRLWVFNVHLNHAPYQPYQLLNIPYGDAPFVKNESEAIDEARKARASEVRDLLAEIDSVQSEGAPIIVTGDFNEPSSLDWTVDVAAAKKCPLAVRWPSTEVLHEAGFIDAYRQAHPDPLSVPGYTWTPITAADDPKDRHDRIDFVLVRGPKVQVHGAKVVGEKTGSSDVVVTPYPSDHRAVVAELQL